MGWWYIKEQWKQINGFEYHYVSNFGNIKSTRRWSGTEFYNREHLSNFIANNEEAIYLKYCEIYPEKITSDFMIEDVSAYAKDNVFFLTEECRWSYIIENAKQNDIALKIDTALSTIERNNPTLRGALPDYYSRLSLDTTKLASLLDEINRINTEDKENDIIGRIYEYFLSKFALSEGKGKGEFYTPKCIVNLIAEMIEPYDGILYDPCCGSGGMFVQSIKFVEAHSGNKNKISIYGQEYTNTTYKLAKMNFSSKQDQNYANTRKISR